MRRTGRTTRLADYIIQQLFNYPGVSVKIVDHHHSSSACEHLCNIITRRLRLEHTGTDFEAKKEKNGDVTIKLVENK